MVDVIGTGPWRVTVIESERGWGSKIDEYRRFETKEEGQAWASEFNSQNTLDYVPEWYMYAQEPAYVP